MKYEQDTHLLTKLLHFEHIKQLISILGREKYALTQSCQIANFQ